MKGFFLGRTDDGQERFIAVDDVMTIAPEADGSFRMALRHSPIAYNVKAVREYSLEDVIGWAYARKRRLSLEGKPLSPGETLQKGLAQ